MDIQKRTETTDIYDAVVGLDVLKQVAIGHVKKMAGIVADATVVLSDAEFDPEKGIVVSIAVKGAAASIATSDAAGGKPDEAPASDADQGAGPQPASTPVVSLTVPPAQYGWTGRVGCRARDAVTGGAASAAGSGPSAVATSRRRGRRSSGCNAA